MYKIKATAQFKKDYDRLPAQIKKRVKKVINLLKANLRHPSIRAKKVQSAQDIWEGRITDFYRFTFKIKGSEIQLRHTGSHNKILKAP